MDPTPPSPARPAPDGAAPDSPPCDAPARDSPARDAVPPDAAPAAAATDDALPPIPDFDPVRVARHRRDGWTAERQRGFITALAETGLVATAARRVGMGVTSAYQLRRRPGGEGFAAAWDMVLEEARERALAFLIDRARNGTTRLRFYRGRYVGAVHGYDTRAACAVVHAAFATGPAPRARKAK